MAMRLAHLSDDLLNWILQANRVEEAIIAFLADRPDGRRVHIRVGLQVLQQLAHPDDVLVVLLWVGHATLADDVVDDLRAAR